MYDFLLVYSECECVRYDGDPPPPLRVMAGDPRFTYTRAYAMTATLREGILSYVWLPISV